VRALELQLSRAPAVARQLGAGVAVDDAEVDQQAGPPLLGSQLLLLLEGQDQGLAGGARDRADRGEF